MPVPGIPDRHLRSRPDIEVDPPEVGLSDADTVRAFHNKGKLSVSIGANALVAVITAGLTWLASHGSGAPVDCASKADMNALDKHVSELGESVRDLQTTINRNADQARNDTAMVATELRSYVNSHAK